MKPLKTFRSAIAVLMLPAAVAMADTAADDLKAQAQVIDYALNGSSVSGVITAVQRQETARWLQSATTNLQQGNLKTAQAQLLEAGRLLYPMMQIDHIALTETKQRRWLNDLDSVLSALQPPAREIAQEKQLPTVTLDAIAYLQQSGREALASNDLQRAETDFVDAYNALQQEVVRLRSGDLLVIELPDPASQSGWKDAERHYADWRFFADWMVTMADAMGTDPQLINQGSEAADRLLNEATQLADRADWKGATAVLDEAYRVMEAHWRKAGIDI